MPNPGPDPEVKIIAVSVHNDGPIPHQLLKIGVLSFISKGSPLDEMVLCHSEGLEGKRYLCSEVANNLAFQGLPESNDSPFSKDFPREKQKLLL